MDALSFFSPHFSFCKLAVTKTCAGRKVLHCPLCYFCSFPQNCFGFFFFSLFSKCQRLCLPSHQCNVCASADAVDAPLLCVFPGSATRPTLYLCVPFKVAVAYDGRHTSLMPTLLHRGGAGAERWPRQPTANQPHRETTHESLLHLQR